MRWFAYLLATLWGSLSVLMTVDRWVSTPPSFTLAERTAVMGVWIAWWALARTYSLKEGKL